MPTPFDALAAYDEFEAALRAYYAYLERADFDVDALLARARAAAAAATDARELKRVLRQATLAFTDPHLSVLPREDQEPNVWPSGSDLALRLATDAFVVADVRADSAADLAGVRPGWSVVSVDGAPIDAAASALLRLVPSPTSAQRAYAATLAVNGRRSGRRTLELRSADGTRRLDLANPREFAEVVAARPPLEVVQRDRLAILRLNNSLGRLETIAAFDAAVERCLEVETLVIDLRNTPSGGNTDVARGLIGHFVSEPRPYQVHVFPAAERRTTVPRRFVEYVLPRPPRYGGRVVVLAGRWTGSMGEGAVIGLHAAAAARTFASEMGRLLGAVHTIELPASGARLDLGAEALFHVDGTPRGDYVADVALPSSDRDAEGRDPALLAVQDWLAAGAR